MAVNVTGGPLDFEASLDSRNFDQQLKKIEGNINRLSGAVRSQGNDIDSFAKKLSVAAASYFSVQAASEFINSMVRVRGEFQQIEIAFTTMLKSKEKADQLMKEAVRLAAVTPFGLQDVAAGAKQLLAYGFSAKEVTQNLEMLGNIASGVGSQLTDVVYLYGTLKASGRVTQMDINQFANRGIPIYEALAQVIGKTTAEVRDYVSAGRIGFPQIEQAFKNMTGPAGQFFNLMQEQSKSLTGQLSNLSDAWARMLNEMGKSQEGILSDSIGIAISLVDNYQQVLDILQALIIVYGSYRAALVAEAALKQLIAARTVGMTTAEILHYQALVLQTAATKAYNAVLAAMPLGMMTLGIAALATSIYSLTQITDAATASQEVMNESKEEGAKAADKELNKINQLMGVIKSQTSSIQQKEAAYKKLQETTNGTLNQYSLEQVAAGKAKVSIDEYIKSIQEAAAARKAWSEFQALADKRDELTRNGIKSVSPWVQAGRALKNQFTPTSQGIGMMDWLKGWVGIGTSDRIVNQELAVVDQQMEALKKAFGDKFDEIISGETKPDVGSASTSKTRTEAFVEGEIKKLTEARSEYAITSKEYADFTRKINALNEELANAQGKTTQAQREYNNVLEDRKKVLEDILKAEQEVNREELISNEREIQQAKDEYDILRLQAKEKGLGSGAITRIDRIEERKTGNIRYKQQTDELIKFLNDQEKLYDDFENYKLEFGEEKAKERYKNELDTSKTYLQLISEEIEKFAKKDNGGQLTGNEQNRIGFLTQKAAAAKVKEQAKIDEAVRAASSHLEQVQAIRRKYADMANKLGSDITESQKAELKARMDEEIKAANKTAFEKTQIYRNLNRDIIQFTKDSLRDEIKAIEGLLKSDLNPSLRAELEKSLALLKSQLESGINEANIAALQDQADELKKALSDPLIAGTELAEEYLKQLIEIENKIQDLNNSSGLNQVLDLFNSISGSGLNLSDVIPGTEKIESLAKALSKTFDNISRSFAELSNAFAGANDDLSYKLATIAEITGALSDSLTSLAKGDVIGAVVKVVATIININKRVKQMNAEARDGVAKFYQTAIEGELTYNALLRERDRQSAAAQATRILGLQKESALLRSQTSEIDKQYQNLLNQIQGQKYIIDQEYKHGTWFRKAQTKTTYGTLAGKSFEEIEKLYNEGRLTEGAIVIYKQLEKLKNEGKDVSDTLAQIAEKTQEIFTGTTADSITNSLFEMFKNGQVGAQELADFFKQTMDDAALSIFKNKILASAMDNFYKEFADKAQSDEMITEQEREDLKLIFETLTKDAVKQFDDLKKITGSDLGGSQSQSKSNTMAGALTPCLESSIEITTNYKLSINLIKKIHPCQL
ncbi:tape measure protein [Daejeonella sp. H1SJ63]|uniref:tape measure protein n=1 Tax=Daejeonella sp. H1SJ63 TaxID=3034145 RepID=UPI0023EBDB4F|nr:tape measure protein [Daejeonella sp. H1SJ63]